MKKITWRDVFVARACIYSTDKKASFNHILRVLHPPPPPFPPACDTPPPSPLLATPPTPLVDLSKLCKNCSLKLCHFS